MTNISLETYVQCTGITVIKQYQQNFKEIDKNYIGTVASNQSDLADDAICTLWVGDIHLTDSRALSASRLFRRTFKDQWAPWTTQLNLHAAIRKP